MAGVKNLFIYWPGTEKAILVHVSTGKATGVHPAGAIGQGVKARNVFFFFFLVVMMKNKINR